MKSPKFQLKIGLTRGYPGTRAAAIALLGTLSVLGCWLLRFLWMRLHGIARDSAPGIVSFVILTAVGWLVLYPAFRRRRDFGSWGHWSGFLVLPSLAATLILLLRLVALAIEGEVVSKGVEMSERR